MPPRTRRPRIPLEAAKPGVTIRVPRTGPAPPGPTAGGGYTWEPFGPGNAAAATHGAGDLSKGHIGRIDPDGKGRGLSLRAQELADAFLAEVLASEAFPEYLKAPMFRADLVDWARAQTQADMFWDYLQKLPQDDWYVPQKTGFQKSPLDQWKDIAAYAAKCRARLGLNPTSYAKLRVALGLHKQQEANVIAGLGRKGDKIVRKHEAKMIKMRAEDADTA